MTIEELHLRSRSGSSSAAGSLPGLMVQPDSKLYSLSSTELLDPSSNISNQVEACYISAEEERLKEYKKTLLKDILNISSVLTDAAAAMVDDSFLKCFTMTEPDPWNWNLYLFPMWCLGVVFRYCILFPIRLVTLLGGLLIFLSLFFLLQPLMKEGPTKNLIERKIVQYISALFVASWTGVIRFHGPRPSPGANRVWVANHTSMIDYIVLTSYSPFSVIMQLHPGWVGFLQTKVLNSLGCLWFNRNEANDRALVARRMKDHVQDPNSTPLLIFPEGTCVNNEYCVMFKRGAFELGATVCPIAIRYNKIFVDAFWNSKRQSFTQHLLKLMTSWAVVCDVYFLEPQQKRPDETSIEFSGRVRHLIATHAKLREVPWDGYLKYYNLGEKHPGLIEKRRRVFADVIRNYLPSSPGTPATSRDKTGDHPVGGSGADQSTARQEADSRITGEVKKDQ